jgi:hypothetical protein
MESNAHEIVALGSGAADRLMSLPEGQPAATASSA